MKPKLSLIFILLLTTTLAQGQVTIGTSKVPAKGALLDLKEKNNIEGEEGKNNASKGLGLPCVELTDLMRLKMGDNDIADAPIAGGGTVWNAHTGLVVYNVKERTTEAGACPGLHVWTGTMWQAITPYPEVETRKVLVDTPTRGAITLLGSYIHGGIINDSDPKWAELGKNPADYPIGATPSIVMIDADNNTYNSQRFYVGYQKETGTYKTEKKFSCDASNSNWVDLGNNTETNEKFVDGIWITSNMYSTQRADGGAFDQGTDIDNQARLNPAYHGTRFGAIPIAVGGLGTSSTVSYGEGINSALGFLNNTVSQKDYARKFGLSYTHHQGTQLCPKGWSMPDDAMWNALADAHGGASSAVAAMRSKPSANGSYHYRSQDKFEYQWGSLATEVGVIPSGFNAFPSGSTLRDREYGDNFGRFTNWWSASTSDSYWYMSYNTSSLGTSMAQVKGFYFSVRCVKN